MGAHWNVLSAKKEVPRNIIIFSPRCFCINVVDSIICVLQIIHKIVFFKFLLSISKLLYFFIYLFIYKILWCRLSFYVISNFYLIFKFIDNVTSKTSKKKFKNIIQSYWI